ncbi:MAG: dihydropyrimidine dehydrogenase, partial [Planctomycetes bacterium]|nr:dihydropyrimidine dehydrogenase [Planctomycetota bacterium]
MPDEKRPFRGGRLFTSAQALLEASRCLQCENAPCTQGCPAGINVRGFIEKLRTENFRGALRLIRERNILGEICAWACPVETLCEGRCSSTQINYPIKIAALQQFVCAQEWGATPALPPKAPPKGKKVAVIGAGPAGLACAFRLVALGYEAEVFEAQAKPGGLLSNAIPPDRLPEDVVQREVELIERYGVRLSFDSPLSDKLTLDTIFQRGFAAVFLGIGLGEAISTL